MSEVSSSNTVTYALAKLPDARHALLHSEACALKEEIERLQQCHREGWLYAEEMKGEFERRGKEVERLRALILDMVADQGDWSPELCKKIDGAVEDLPDETGDNAKIYSERDVKALVAAALAVRAEN